MSQVPLRMRLLHRLAALTLATALVLPTAGSAPGAIAQSITPGGAVAPARQPQPPQTPNRRTIGAVIDALPEVARAAGSARAAAVTPPANLAAQSSTDVAAFVADYLFSAERRPVEAELVDDTLELGRLLAEAEQTGLPAEREAELWTAIEAKREQLRVHLRVLNQQWRTPGPKGPLPQRAVRGSDNWTDAQRGPLRDGFAEVSRRLDDVLAARAAGQDARPLLAPARAAVTALGLRTQQQPELPMDEPNVQAVPVQPAAQLVAPTPRVDRLASSTSAPAFRLPRGRTGGATLQGQAAPEAISIQAVPAPTPGATAATLEVQLTQEIRDLAARLGNDPLRIYNYVRDNIDVGLYYGSKLGATGTLWAKRGNDYDQASLLIALLRAANIPAQYVSGRVQMTGQQARDWLGVTSTVAAGALLNGTLSDGTGGNYSNFDGVEFDHVWVEAYVPYSAVRSGGGADPTASIWVPMAPSFKLRNFQPGINVNGAGELNYTNYLSARQRYLPSELYQDQVRTWLYTNQPGKTLNDVAYSGTIIPSNLTTLPASLPFNLINQSATFTEISDTLRQKVTIRLQSGGTQLFATTLTVPAIVTARLTLGYNVVSGTTLQPVLRQDGTTIATGSNTTQGTANTLTFTLITPRDTNDDTVYPNITAGDYHALYLDAGQSSQRLLDERTQRLINATATIGTAQENRDDLLGELLHVALVKYNIRINEGIAVADSIKKVVTTSQTRIGVTRAANTVQYRNDVPFAVFPSKLNIDFKRNVVGIVAVDGTTNSTRDLSVMRLQGYTASALEHQIWEDLTKLDSISTMKGLQWANERGIGILTCTTVACIDTNAPSMGASYKQQLYNEVNRGQEVTAPRRELTTATGAAYNNWQGFVYISRTPATGAAGYIISGSTAGGDTTTSVVRTEPRYYLGGGPNPSAVTVSGDPVNVANGNLIHPETDFSIKSRAFDLTWRRIYNSQSTYNGPLGYGWTHSYNTHLVIDGLGNVTVRTADGGEYTFAINGTAYTSPPGVFETLTLSGGVYTLTQRDGKTQTFTSAGRMTAIRDTTGNQITLGYNANNQLSTITDPAGRNLTLTYNANGKLAQVQDWTGRQWRYFYEDAAGNLTKYTDPLGNSVLYSYYSGGANDRNLRTVTDRRGNAITFAYYSNDKVFWHTNGLGEKRFFSYNPFWQQTVDLDEVGERRIYDYDAQGQLIKLTEPTGGVHTYVWNSSRNIQSRTDALGRTTSYTYDAKGNVRRETNAIGQYTDTQYHPTFNKPTVIDRNGQITRMGYNPVTGNLNFVTDTLGLVTSYTYDAVGNLRTVTVPKPDNRTHPNNTTTYTYDANNLYLTQVTNALGHISRFQYDTLGRLQWEENALNRRTTYSYSLRDEALTVTDPDNNVVRMGYDAAGNLTTKTDARGFTTRYTYDAFNRQTQVQYPDGSSEQLRYDGLGRLIGKTDARGGVWTYGYDGLGKQNRIVDPLGNTLLTTYDAMGNVIQTTDANGRVTTYAYDRADRRTRMTDALGKSTLFQFDIWNNTTVITNANGFVTRNSYDNANRLTQTTDAENQVIRYGYDRLGHTSVITDAENNPIRFEFTVVGQLQRVRDALGNTTVYTYNQANWLTEMRDANGQRMTFSYDTRGRMTGRSYQNGTSDSFAFDTAGNVLAANNANVNLSYEYDSMNRLIRLSDSRFGKAISYEYDQAGNLITMINPENAVTRYSYDAANRLIQQVFPTGVSASYVYDRVGNRTERRLSNGFRTTYTYDELNRVREQISYSPTNAVQARSTYTFDNVGNILSMVDLNGTTNYTYNKVNWLTQASYPGGSYETFTYFKQGNRRSVTTASGTTNYCYDAANRLVSLGATCPGGATTTFGYDNNGNQTTKTEGGATTTYSYSQRNQLTGIVFPAAASKPNSVVAYDANGDRVRKVDSTGETRYFVDARKRVVAEYNASNVWQATNYHGTGLDELIGRGTSTQNLYYQTDALGSVIAIADNAGVEQARYSYNAFGAVRSKTGTLANSWTFTGREQDPDSGLLYLRARYYDPIVGRFISKDPIGVSGGLNLYQYANSNPLKYLDLTGKAPHSWLDGVQTTLDVVGVFDPFGIADTVNAGISLARGDYAGAALTIAGVIPVIGDTFKAAKYTDEAVNAVRAVNQVADSYRSVCSFSPDTLVSTARGLKRIADIRPGERVLAYNERSRSTGSYTVTATMAHRDPLLVKLTIDGETVETTPEHPFANEHGVWIAAADLRPGERIARIGGRLGTVQHVSVERRDRLMHNLTVGEAHTFFVGEGRWLVHNSCPIFLPKNQNRQFYLPTSGTSSPGYLVTGHQLEAAAWKRDGTAWVERYSSGGSPLAASLSDLVERKYFNQVNNLSHTEPKALLDALNADLDLNQPLLLTSRVAEPPCSGCKSYLNSYHNLTGQQVIYQWVDAGTQQMRDWYSTPKSGYRLFQPK